MFLLVNHNVEVSRHAKWNTLAWNQSRSIKAEMSPLVRSNVEVSRPVNLNILAHSSNADVNTNILAHNNSVGVFPPVNRNLRGLLLLRKPWLKQLEPYQGDG